MLFSEGFTLRIRPASAATWGVADDVPLNARSKSVGVAPAGPSSSVVGICRQGATTSTSGPKQAPQNGSVDVSPTALRTSALFEPPTPIVVGSLAGNRDTGWFSL